MQGIWILERCTSDRFPFRLQIEREGKPWLVLRAQDHWPAAGKRIFCLREEEPPEPGEIVDEVERVNIVAFHERGKRSSIVLDRKRYKRCDFLFISKPYKNRPGESYEQIFWLTQKAIAQHRPAYRLVSRSSNAEFTVGIDSHERYPWSFTGIATKRVPLPVGDYALLDGKKILALVERKTLDNLIADFGKMPVLHQQLAELATYQNNALVIEALYADFLNPAKVHHYTASFCAKAIGELHALHPNLRIIYCSNRKVANEWTRHYFTAVWNTRHEHEMQRKSRKR